MDAIFACVLRTETTNDAASVSNLGDSSQIPLARDLCDMHQKIPHATKNETTVYLARLLQISLN